MISELAVENAGAMDGAPCKPISGMQDAFQDGKQKDASEVQESQSSETVSCSNSSSPEARRRRSQSDSTAPTTDVGTVVSKAKRAASSLWMLIHAQHCTVGNNGCQQKGCLGAKNVLLHLKSCPAQHGDDCPTAYYGCHQARKLLAHHRRCRELRAKQTGMRGSVGTKSLQPHACLVCSLVARHARNVLEVGKPSTSSMRRHPSGPRTKVVASFTLQQNGAGNSNGITVPKLEDSVTHAQGMPPPAPRQPNSNPATASCATAPVGRESPPDVVCESPPTPNQLLQFSEVAAATALPCMNHDTNADGSALGKSLDSSKSSFLTFAAGMLHQMKKAHQEKEFPHRRIRAESFDVATAAVRKMRQHDPTLEMDLRDGTSQRQNGRQNTSTALLDPSSMKPRARSVSVGGVMAHGASRRPFDTIDEETPEPRQPPFPMEEDK